MRGEIGKLSSFSWRVVASAPKNRRNNELRKCARCHFALGIGIKISAHLLGCSTKIPVMIRREGGATGIRLKSGKAAYRPISPKSEALVDHFEAGWMDIIAAEQRGIRRIDSMWSNCGGHVEFKRWRSAKSAAKRYDAFKSDPSFRLARICRHRIWKMLKGYSRSERSTELVGCTWEKLAKHLQSQFEHWMSWDNYGSEWHVDHIKPCAAFDLSIERERFACFHYTNLRPLRSIDNWSKNSRFNGVLLRKRANIQPLALS